MIKYKSYDNTFRNIWFSIFRLMTYEKLENDLYVFTLQVKSSF